MPLAFPTSATEKTSSLLVYHLRKWQTLILLARIRNMGGLLVFKLKGSNRALTTDEDVRELFVHMISESVLELRESGSMLYD